ncbi:atos homolog protein A isoform X2 [Bacillus rossius redtenbacheri]|uniref:atos homolog protein A isoform X2 n=1 Tax=Bacillus rossius redtenbacheri TaxID=93214 RepID=UPI002FDCF924
MKPSGEDMHAMLEGGEERAEPHEVFVDLGVLVVEGRVPGGAWAATRGYGEGPHCAGLGIAGSTGRHDCDPAGNSLCKRAENLQKHMQLLWQNSIPMCIEVLLCPDCPCGAQKSQSPEVSNIPSPTDLLLEQWMITMVSRKHLEQPQVPARGLFQAVRSQLHFSQLAAWWSRSKGGSPVHVSYRVTVPGEAFASQFQRPPLEHSFPVAVVARNSAIKVSVRMLPRMESVPQVVCGVHPSGNEKQEAQCVGDAGLVAKKSDGDARDWRKESSAASTDHLLGESLLDPPHSLDLFARRYQSPSRCGSPCMEAPEHLMFSRVPAKPEIPRCLLPRWRESSPPSPPLTAPTQRRLGRQGLARRRDATDMGAERGGMPWVDDASKPLPGLVDDRLQNPCNLPGKHHCYCAYDEDLDELPKVVGQHQRRRQAGEPKELFSVNRGDHHPNTTSAACSKKALQRGKAPSRADGGYQRLGDDGKDGLVAEICDTESSFGAIRVAKRRSGMKMEGRDGEASCKLNLELSRQEFDEVLAVLRDRNGSPSLSSGKKQSSSQACIPPDPTCDNTRISSETGSVQKQKPSVSSSQRSDLVYSVHTVTPTTSACPSARKTLDKADLLMGAILRTNSNGSCVPAVKTDSAAGRCPVSVLNEKLIKCKHKKDEPEIRNLRDICDNLKVNCDNKADLGSYRSASLNKSDSVGRLQVSTCDTQSGENCIISKSRYLLIKDGANDCTGIKLKSAEKDDVQNTICTAKNASFATGAVATETDDISNVPKCLSASPVNPDEAQILKSDSRNNCRVSNVPFVSSDCDQTAASGEGSAKPPRSPNNCNGVKADDGCDTRNQAEGSGRKKRPSSPLIIPTQVAEPVPSQLLDSQEESEEDNLSDRPVPSALDKAKFRRSFDSAASMVFHSRTGLPLTSSPAPVRRGTSRFDFDSSLNSVSAIRSALFESSTPAPDDSLSVSSDDAESEGSARSPCSPGLGLASPAAEPLWLYCPSSPCASLLGSFEESVLNGRLEPVSTVQGFRAELGASGSFCPKHLLLPVTVFFYTLGDNDKVSIPYLGHINLGKKGYHVPRSGTIQVTLFNPLGTVIKMFVVMYDLGDMPANSQTFLRQRTLYMPASVAAASSRLPDNPQKWLRYLIHLRFSSSKSGRIHLHSDIRMIICRKSDMDTATAHDIDMSFELRSFTHGPANPKFSPRK